MPGYSDLHRTLLGGIPYIPTRAFQVLELGVGTGTLSSLVLSEFPHARLTGVDLSPKMIARARAKLRPFRDRVELVAGDLGEFEQRPYRRQSSRRSRSTTSRTPRSGGSSDGSIDASPREGTSATRTTTSRRTRRSTPGGRRSRRPLRWEDGRRHPDGIARRWSGTTTNDSTTRRPSRLRSRRSSARGSRTSASPGGSSVRPSCGPTSKSDQPGGGPLLARAERGNLFLRPRRPTVVAGMG